MPSWHPAACYAPGVCAPGPAQAAACALGGEQTTGQPDRLPPPLAGLNGRQAGDLAPWLDAAGYLATGVPRFTRLGLQGGGAGLLDARGARLPRCPSRPAGHRQAATVTSSGAWSGLGARRMRAARSSVRGGLSCARGRTASCRAVWPFQPTAAAMAATSSCRPKGLGRAARSSSGRALSASSRAACSASSRRRMCSLVCQWRAASAQRPRPVSTPRSRRRASRGGEAHLNRGPAEGAAALQVPVARARPATPSERRLILCSCICLHWQRI